MLRIIESEVIGAGEEKTVYSFFGDTRCVIAVYHQDRAPETQYQTKALYYLQKIKHLLFPENFPNIHSARHGERVLIIVDRIKTDEGHRAMTKFILGKCGPVSLVSPDEDVVAILKFRERIIFDPNKAKLEKRIANAGLGFDNAFCNYTYDHDGNLVNLDVTSALSGCGKRAVRYYNPKALEAAIQKISDEGKKKMALAYLSRLEKLFEELSRDY